MLVILQKLITTITCPWGTKEGLIVSPLVAKVTRGYKTHYYTTYSCPWDTKEGLIVSPLVVNITSGSHSA